MTNSDLRTPNHQITWLITTGLVAAMLLSGVVKAKDNQVFHWHSAVASGKTVVVSITNGSIEASLSPNGEVQVEAIKTGSSADQFKVALSESNDGIRICLEPEKSTSAKPCENAALAADLRVDFKLQLPAGVAFVANNVNGAVKASSLQSRVDATTVNGDITISTTESINSARTGNGSLDLAMGKLWTGLLSVKTQNGDIRLKLPRHVSFQPSGKGQTLITGSGPVQMKGFAVTQAQNRKGAPELEISTTHGNVTISTQD